MLHPRRGPTCLARSHGTEARHPVTRRTRRRRRRPTIRAQHCNLFRDTIEMGDMARRSFSRTTGAYDTRLRRLQLTRHRLQALMHGPAAADTCMIPDTTPPALPTEAAAVPAGSPTAGVPAGTAVALMHGPACHARAIVRTNSSKVRPQRVASHLRQSLSRRGETFLGVRTRERDTAAAVSAVCVLYIALIIMNICYIL
jgi:hypothetical protein